MTWDITPGDEMFPPRPMTQQEALAQALRSGKVARTFAGYLDGEHGIEVAVDAILDELHGNGYDVRPTPTITIVRERQLWDDGVAFGAQQERERLRALVLAEEDVHERAVRFTLAYILDLLADPEDEA